MNEWRNWLTSPPTIPWAPIEVAVEGCESIAVVTTGARIKSPAADLVYRPLGIYREEIWQVSNEWV